MAKPLMRTLTFSVGDLFLYDYVINGGLTYRSHLGGRGWGASRLVCPIRYWGLKNG